MALAWARQKHFFILSIGFFVLFLFLLPLPSYAKFEETGPSCTPELIPDSGDIPTPGLVTCPWCEKNGSTKLRLTWDLDQKDLGDHYCYISCSNPDRGCQSITGKDFDGVATSSSLFAWNLRQKDEIYLPSARDNNRYTIYCNSREVGGGSVYSAPVKVVNDCRVPCEVGFKEIKDNLYFAQFFLGASPVAITEESFKSWSALDNLDKCLLDDSGQCDPWTGEGSGDGTDIKVSMIFNQECQTALPRTMSNEEVLKELQNYGAMGYPVHLTLRQNDGEISFNHAVIALGVVGYVETDDLISILVLDPNGPEKELVYCERTNPFSTDSSEAYQCKLTQYGGFGDSVDDLHLQIYMPSGILGLIEEYEAICAQEINKNKNICKKDPAARLMEDYPDIDNPANDSIIPNDNRGNCFGWTEFVLRVAYLGDFVGTDYHPDDGKYVGVDCDANHYPIQKKSSFIGGAEGWLANLLQPLKNLKLK